MKCPKPMRKPAVVQTQVILSVMGALVMLAFGWSVHQRLWDRSYQQRDYREALVSAASARRTPYSLPSVPSPRRSSGIHACRC